MKTLSTLTLSLTLLATAITNVYADDKTVTDAKAPVQQGVAQNDNANKNVSNQDINDFFKSVLGDDLSVKTTDAATEEEANQKNSKTSQIDLKAIDSEFAKLQESIGGLSSKKQPNGQLSESGALDRIFLRNIPEGTRLTVNKDYNVLPQSKYIIFHNGERVIESPLYKNPLTTFCYIELAPSGKARVLRKDKQLIVTKNITTSSEIKNEGEEWRGTIKLYESKIFVDNDNIKWISCYSASLEKQNKKPLAVQDLREQTNSAFKIEFPAYEEI